MAKKITDEQIKKAYDKFIADGGKVKKLPKLITLGNEIKVQYAVNII